MTSLLSLAPHQSDLPASFPLKASRRSPTLPQVDLCKNCVSSPHPKLPFPLIHQNFKNSVSNSLYFIPSLSIQSSRASLIVFSEIDPERALSCPRRASYEAERGLMLP